jgi:hypothetical protein
MKLFTGYQQVMHRLSTGYSQTGYAQVIHRQRRGSRKDPLLSLISGTWNFDYLSMREKKNFKIILISSPWNF